jgi:hypothetical protein
LAFARERAGNNIAARIAIIAMTTSSSISVKANLRPLWLAAGNLFIRLQEGTTKDHAVKSDLTHDNQRRTLGDALALN